MTTTVKVFAHAGKSAAGKQLQTIVTVNSGHNNERDEKVPNGEERSYYVAEGSSVHVTEIEE